MWELWRVIFLKRISAAIGHVSRTTLMNRWPIESWRVSEKGVEGSIEGNFNFLLESGASLEIFV